MTNISSDATAANLGAAGFVPVFAGGQSTYSVDNTIFDVRNGASLTLTGSSDTVMIKPSMPTTTQFRCRRSLGKSMEMATTLPSAKA